MKCSTHKARPRIEPLEVRELLSTCMVTRLSDTGAGQGLRGDFRYCITTVNAAPGPDVIDFNVSGTINLNRALPSLKSEIDIQGPGAEQLTVRRDKGGNYRVFTVTGGPVTISGLSVRDGYAAKTGGGIHNSAVLTIRDSIIAENYAADNLAARGGGIYNLGSLTVTRSTISGNTAYAFLCLNASSSGGGIHNAGKLQIVDSTISGNEAHLGSYCYYPKAQGGGIYNANTLGVLNSTISGNWAYAFDLYDYYGEGGGVYNQSVAVVRHSTIARNVTGLATTGLGGGGFSNHGTLHLRNTIVAENFSNIYANDLRGAIGTSGYNLIGERQGGSGYAPTDILGVDPMLATLADNGGPTQTIALLPGSPAIDAGDNTGAPEWDQRGPGFPRIVNGTVDIGAFEVQTTVAPSVNRPFWELSMAMWISREESN